MKLSILKDLWQYTALPIVLFLLVLITVVSIAQSRAESLQSEPIYIKISKTDRPDTREDREANVELPQFAAESEEGMIFGEVRGQLDSGNYEQALKTLESLDVPEEKSEMIHFYRAYSFNRMGDKNSAIESYIKALEVEPNYYEAAINLGIIYLSAGRVDQATAILEKAVTLGGGLKKAKALTLLGKAYNRGGLYIRAEESLMEAINLKPADLEARNELGSVYTRRNEISKAQSIFEEVLKLEDSNGEALMGLAELSLLDGKMTEAEKLLERAITAVPYFDQGRLKLARILADSGRNDEAITHLRWILDNGSDLSGASFLLGLINYNSGHFEKAALHYEQAFEESGERHIESLNNLALALKSQGKLDQATVALSKAIALDSQYEKAYYNLGLIYLDNEEPQLALESFQKVIEINPLHEQAWYNIGYIHSQRGAVKASIQSYEKTLEINPVNTKCRLNLAVQYNRDGQTDKAEKQYNIVLSINPAYSSAWYNLGLLLKKRNSLDEAEEAYLKAIELEPENAKYRYSLALIYENRNNPEGAITVLEEALDISPDDQSLRFKLAKLLVEAGRVSEAENQFKTVLSLDEKFGGAWESLASLYMGRDEYEMALQSYDRALALDVSDNYLHYLKGKALYKMDRHDEAVSSYEKALTSINDNSWIWYHLGKALDKLGLEERSDEAYNKSLEINPNMGRFVINKLEYTDDSFDLLEKMVEEDRENSSLPIQLAKLYMREGDSEKAIASLDRFMQMNSDDPDLWEQAGDTAEKGGEPALAERIYGHLLRMDPGNGDVLYKQALLIEERGDFESSIEELKKALELMDSPYKATVKLGDLYYKLKEYGDSVLYFEKAAEFSEKDSLLYDLGKAYYRNKQYEKALESLKRASELRPDYLWTYIWLGRTYARLDNYRDAESLYRLTLEKDPAFLQGYISLGDLAGQENKPEEAKSLYERALELEPLNDSVRNKLRRISD